MISPQFAVIMRQPFSNHLNPATSHSAQATNWLRSHVVFVHRLGLHLPPGIQPTVFYSVLFLYSSQSVFEWFYMFLSMKTVSLQLFPDISG